MSCNSWELIDSRQLNKWSGRRNREYLGFRRNCIHNQLRASKNKKKCMSYRKNWPLWGFKIPNSRNNCNAYRTRITSYKSNSAKSVKICFILCSGSTASSTKNDIGFIISSNHANFHIFSLKGSYLIGLVNAMGYKRG